MKQFQANYKSLVPAIVGVGIMTYEVLSGHQISAHNQSVITNDVVAGVGFVLTVVGIAINHFKKKDVAK